MRNGSAVIVPLFLGIMILFWFIYFMGGANDNLHKVTKMEHVKHVEERLLKAAIAKRIKLLEANAESPEPLSKTEIDTEVNDYIAIMMQRNNID
jgi:hypothetical protein